MANPVRVWSWAEISIYWVLCVSAKEGFERVACYFRVENVKLGCDFHGQVELSLHTGGNVLSVLPCCVYRDRAIVGPGAMPPIFFLKNF